MSDLIQRDCPAKINLGLKILGQRADNYHDIYTIFQAIGLYDHLVVERKNSWNETRFSTNLSNLAFDDTNTLYKAWESLRRIYHITDHLDIYLEKHIPAGGGLGGGSSDAAGFIQAVDQIFQLSMSLEDKFQVARNVGMDVPFFLNETSAIGTSRGDYLFPVEILDYDYQLVLWIPPFSVSTAEIYRAYKFPLTKSDFFIKIEALLRNGNARKAIRLNEFIHILENDLEKAAFPLYPDLKRWKNCFLANGAVSSLMSGSGSSLFALFRKDSCDLEKLYNDLSISGGRLVSCEPLLG